MPSPRPCYAVEPDGTRRDFPSFTAASRHYHLNNYYALRDADSHAFARSQNYRIRERQDSSVKFYYSRSDDDWRANYILRNTSPQ